MDDTQTPEGQAEEPEAGEEQSKAEPRSGGKKPPTEEDVRNLHRLRNKAEQQVAEERKARQKLEDDLNSLREELEIAKQYGDDEDKARLQRDIAKQKRELSNRERELQEREDKVRANAKDMLVDGLVQRYGVPRAELEDLDVDEMQTRAKDWYIEQLEKRGPQRQPPKKAEAEEEDETPPQKPKPGFESGEPQVSRKSPLEMTKDEFNEHVRSLKTRAGR